MEEEEEEEAKSVQPCEICDDIGHVPAIVTCSNCRRTREHIYCMNPNLLKYPYLWNCEACRRKKVDRDSCNRNAGVVHNLSAKKVPFTRIIRPPRKVQFLPVEDIYTLEAGTKRKKPDTKCFPRSRTGLFDTDHNHMRKSTSATHITHYASPEVDAVHRKYGCQNTLQEFDEVDCFLRKSRECMEKHGDVAEHCDDGETSYKVWEEDIPNPPAANPSWKGSFEILNFPHELYDGLRAYPPGSVSFTAYLVSQKMPKVLQLTLHPRLDVWPQSFHKDSPSELDIGLYFWAEGCCRKKYDSLLELMVKEDLSMQCLLNGAELRIFTSRQLPVESQRINQQYYLWGLFLSSKGEHYSVNSRAIEQVEIGSAHVSNEADDSVTKGLNGQKEFSKDTSDINSEERGQKRISGRASKQVETEYGSRKVHELKKEYPDDLDGPPGFARRVVHERPIVPSPKNTTPVELLHKTNITRPLQPVERRFCDGIDVPPGFSRTKREESDSPPGFSRQVISDTAVRNTSVAATSPENIPRHLQQGERDCYTPALSRVDVHHPVQESSPPEFSRPITGAVAGQNPIAIPKLTGRMSTIARHSQHAQKQDYNDIASPRTLTHMEKPQTHMPMQLQQVKREGCLPASLGNSNAPPGFSKQVTGAAAGLGPIATSPMNMSDSEPGWNNVIASHSQFAETKYYDDIDAPPGFSRASRMPQQVKQENSDVFDAPPDISKPVTSDVAPKVDAPPELSESANLKFNDYSPKVLPSVTSTSPPRKLRKVSPSSTTEAKRRPIQKNADYFCRICRVPGADMDHLLEHFASWKHTDHVQVMRSKEAAGLRREQDVFLNKSTTYIAHYPVRRS